MSKLQGQCVVITGASSGLGREAAFQFVAAGAARELFRIELASLARGVARLRGRFRRAAVAASS